MKFKSMVKVLGMKSSSGTMDNGMVFDSTKVYVETPLDDSKGTAKGYATSEYNLGDSKEYARYSKLNFPFEAEAEMEIVTSGKQTKTVMRSLVPLPAPIPGKAA
ncbi:hypothetical protein GPA19_17890 [Azoarcus indigens]|uniref:Uncharacterized protein n=1 Tax=Azoarcus indigens TaxID=29545 RepID=A0A4V3BLK1_9RHOO|nr:hypothetical protein [Azoarcus indigens]NMG66814.1 hypothetical protein [Azoarcus indigens]TDN46982.1 hypothetical protein C7389_12355 [Azoarcus indigens]